jgi:cytochrome d ubiquinol oxidase subunit I
VPDLLHKLHMPEHQAAEVTVMEDDWAAQEIVPFISDGFRGEEPLMINDAIEVPRSASLILTHNIESEIHQSNAFVSQCYLTS